MADTSIEWTEKTWNPTTGCDRNPRSQPGPANPNWGGGRTITKSGYVLVKYPSHPAADVRGYVYEHRLVMEATLGRYLRAGERVRHNDRNPGNNSPLNLTLVRPLDRVAKTKCACGCGASMTKLDSSGRLRRYVSGHNTPRGVRPGARPRHESGSGIPGGYRQSLTEAFGGQCAYGCGRSASCWDHVIPWCLGGSFLRAGNTVPACRSCNVRKNGTPDIWPWIERGISAGRDGSPDPLYRRRVGSAAARRPRPSGAVVTPRRVRVMGDLFHGRIPDGAVYVGRAAPGLKASPFANPHRVGRPCKACPGVTHATAEAAVGAYVRDTLPALADDARRDLAGSDVACWCAVGAACHGDPLLAVANGGAR